MDSIERSPVSNVDIYLDRSQVKRNFKEVGLIIAKEGEWDAYYGTGNEAKLIDMIKTKAMSIGADGVVLLGNEQKMRPGSDCWIRNTKSFPRRLHGRRIRLW